MDLNKITDINELKAMAYDQLVIQETASVNLQKINQRLAELKGEEPTDKK